MPSLFWPIIYEVRPQFLLNTRTLPAACLFLFSSSPPPIPSFLQVLPPPVDARIVLVDEYIPIGPVRFPTSPSPPVPNHRMEPRGTLPQQQPQILQSAAAVAASTPMEIVSRMKLWPRQTNRRFIKKFPRSITRRNLEPFQCHSVRQSVSLSVCCVRAGNSHARAPAYSDEATIKSAELLQLSGDNVYWAITPREKM